MPRLKLKVCGMRESANILGIGNMQPDFMGFIFYKESPRFVGVDFRIPDSLSKDIKRIGVFVNADFDETMAAVAKHKLDVVQLHGDETEDLCLKLKSKVQVVKAFAVDDTFDFDTIRSYETAVDYFLFDTKGAQRGGNGVAFNWQVLKKYKGDIPFFLSGGIDLDNLGGAIKINHPGLMAVDINSGIEIKPGLKDVNKFSKVKQLITSL